MLERPLTDAAHWDLGRLDPRLPGAGRVGFEEDLLVAYREHGLSCTNSVKNRVHRHLLAKVMGIARSVSASEFRGQVESALALLLTVEMNSDPDQDRRKLRPEDAFSDFFRNRALAVVRRELKHRRRFHGHDEKQLEAVMAVRPVADPVRSHPTTADLLNAFFDRLAATIRDPRTSKAFAMEREQATRKKIAEELGYKSASSVTNVLERQYRTWRETNALRSLADEMIEQAAYDDVVDLRWSLANKPQ